MFETVLGNEPIKAYLRRACVQNRLPHALLFSGIDGIGKQLFAKELAAFLLGSPLQRIEKNHHPDCHFICPEGTTSGLHSIESLRTLIDEVHATPFEAPRKVFVIEEAERMQPAAANALLKTLEEPNLDTTIILLTSAPTEMIPTILSRCVRLAFQPLAEGDIATLLRQRGISHPELFAKRAHGSMARALDLTTKPNWEEPLFHLLSQKLPFWQSAPLLEKIEDLVDNEDPVQKHRNIESLYSTMLMWARDQHARALGMAQNHLFFPESPPAAFPLASLNTIHKAIEEARLASSRNMKLAVCLSRVVHQFLRGSAP